MKIKHMLYILLLVFSFVPFTVFAVFMIYENDKHIAAIMEENLRTVSGSHTLDINNFCLSRKENMQVLANLEMVKHAVRMQLNDEENTTEYLDFMQDILAERKSYNSFVKSITVIDRNLLVVASTEPHQYREQSNLVYTDDRKLSGEFIISDLIDRRAPGDEFTQVLAAYIGIYDGEDLIGYLVEEIDPAYFDSHRTQSKLWETGTVYLTDGNKKIIVAGSEEERRSEYVTDEENRSEYREKLAAVDLEAEPSGEIRYHVGTTEYITYYATIEYTDWMLLLTVDLSSYMVSHYAFRFFLVLVTVMTLSFLAVAAYYFTRKITKPINNIIDTMEQIQEKEDYTLRISTRSARDEISMLAQKINELLAYIEKETLQEKELQRYLARKAERDPLTGVKNKEAIEAHLMDLVEKCREERQGVAVGFLDIDDFRDYNTKYGHMAGDIVIQQVASVLGRNITGLVGRNGGDEFLFGIQNVADYKAVEDIAQKIMRELNQGCYNKEAKQQITVRCSIGIVYTRQFRQGYSDLVRSADEAMYRAKENGKNCYEIVDADTENIWRN